jgi:hypothetical protein
MGRGWRGADQATRVMLGIPIWPRPTRRAAGTSAGSRTTRSPSRWAASSVPGPRRATGAADGGSTRRRCRASTPRSGRRPNTGGRGWGSDSCPLRYTRKATRMRRPHHLQRGPARCSSRRLHHGHAGFDLLRYAPKRTSIRFCDIHIPRFSRWTGDRRRAAPEPGAAVYGVQPRHRGGRLASRPTLRHPCGGVLIRNR